MHESRGVDGWDGVEGREEERREHTLAMAINTEKIMGAIQCVWPGPREVHAKPKRPIGSRGAAICVQESKSVRCKERSSRGRVGKHDRVTGVWRTDTARNRKRHALHNSHQSLASGCVPSGSLRCCLRNFMIGGIYVIYAMK